MTYYKFLDPKGQPRNGGTMPYSLPRGKRPGKWMPKVPVVPCETGYHACREQDLLDWIGPECWEIELRGCITECDNKVAAPEARLLRKLPWDERIARHFICDCAERALAVAGNPDPRSVESIRVARLFADGKATRDELNAAWDAAWAAERSWQTRRLVHYLHGGSVEEKTS